MARINAHVDDHDLEDEVYDLPNGEVAKIEKLAGPTAEGTWVIYYWGSRSDYEFDHREGAGHWALCTVSLALDSYMDAAEQIEHDVKKES